MRHGVLFFRQVTEEFPGHFLQTLYAKNDRYFPGRKRTEQAAAGLEKKPENCFERLTQIVKPGSGADTTASAVRETRKPAAGLKAL